MTVLAPTRKQYNALEKSYRLCCDQKAKLAIENRLLLKAIEKLEVRSKDYLTIYQLLSKHHPPTKEGLTNDR